MPGLSAMETVKTHAPHESVIGLHSVGSWVYIVNEEIFEKEDEIKQTAVEFPEPEY